MDLDDGDFLEKNVSQGGDGILGGSDEGISGLDLTLRLGTSMNFDLNMPQDERDEGGSGIHVGFSGFPEKQTGDSQSRGVRFDVDLREMEGHPDDEIANTSNNSVRFSATEKGKEIFYETSVHLDSDAEVEPIFTFRDQPVVDCYSNFTEKEKSEEEHLTKMVELYASRKRQEKRRHYESAQIYAQIMAEKRKARKATVRTVEEESEDPEAPFAVAMAMLKTENSSRARKRSRKSLSFDPGFTWTPAVDGGCRKRNRLPPSLLELSLRVLAENADAMVSLEHVPDELRHKLCEMVCCFGKMDAHFMELLARGCPTEIRVNDCSRLREEEFVKIFASCDCKNLVVLQLDLCGPCLPDKVLHETLARSSRLLFSLDTISLVGAYRLSDDGLTTLAISAPALQSINLSKCPLITSGGISTFISSFEFTLREIYLDECQNVDAMLILPALTNLGHLEVLSVAGISTVCDDFVIGMVMACGRTMKELVFANCVNLTDRSLQFVGRTCSKLCALDLSYLHNLTDSTMKYLTNGCLSLNRLKLCRNDFSDEATAAFLLASGNSLRELSLNNIARVGVHTALSLAKSSRNLIRLDLSWCRKITDELLGLIVDSCLSLRLLKLFGCNQITDVFLSGHSNYQLHIIGLKMTPLTKHLNVFEHQEAPLRYSTLTGQDD